MSDNIEMALKQVVQHAVSFNHYCLRDCASDALKHVIGSEAIDRWESLELKRGIVDSSED